MNTLLSVTTYAILKSAAYTPRQQLLAVAHDLKAAGKLVGRDAELAVINELADILDDVRAPEWSSKVKLPLKVLPTMLVDTVESGNWLAYNLFLRGVWLAARRELHLAKRPPVKQHPNLVPLFPTRRPVPKLRLRA